MTDRKFDATERFCAAALAHDVESIMTALSPGAELVSPISGRMIFRGHDDLRVLFAAVFAVLDELRWAHRTSDGDVQVVVSRAKVRPVRVSDAMVLELDDDGRIRRITPHMRPWLGLTLFALRIAPRIARHPGVIRRAFA